MKAAIHEMPRRFLTGNNGADGSKNSVREPRHVSILARGVKILRYFTINGLAEHVGGVTNAGPSPCSFHGARGGAPKGEANGAWKHGYYSAAAKAERLLVKLLLKNASSVRKLFSGDET